ncbi:complex I NDUFA9 subunit family protein [Microvirga sp. W0021]|uniref:Complex I NDUFA9 subunit family protein n=1 Tax=Hohaiivirga grylli TaxID=3133970 RepID=A0ABV0BFW4_9HYPH
MARNKTASQPAISPIIGNPASQQVVTVFGGGGFLGRYVVRSLTKRGYRVRVAVRNPNQAVAVLPFGNVGQVVIVQANMRNRASLEQAVRGSHAVINLTGIMYQRGAQTFQSVHVDGPKALAEVTPADTKLIHVSAIGANAGSKSVYAKTKGEGEAAVLAARKDAVIFRPSVLFGPGDGLFNRLGELARLLPVMPVIGPDTHMQPVYAGDVAEAIALAVEGKVEGGRIYELGGPACVTMRDISAKVLQVTERSKKIFALSSGFASFAASCIHLADRLTLGLVIPRDLVFTRDQVELLKADNVVSSDAEKEGRTLSGIGIEPTAYEGIIPSYLERFRKAGEFEDMRERRKLANKV